MEKNNLSLDPSNGKISKEDVTVSPMDAPIPAPAPGPVHAPVITVQPEDVCFTLNDPEGSDTVTFKVEAIGSPTLKYQWQFSYTDGVYWQDTMNVAGIDIVMTESTLTVTSMMAGNNGYWFRCIVSNNFGSVTSNIAKLTVLSPPRISSNPFDRIVSAGSNATFKCEILTFAPNLTGILWECSANGIDWSPITTGITNEFKSSPSVSTSILVLAGITADMNGYQYRCTGINGILPNAVSNAATLTVTAAAPSAPVFIRHPEPVIAINPGENATFKVEVTGTPTPTLQWMRGLNPLPDAPPYSGVTTKELKINGATMALHQEPFECRATNVAGYTDSNCGILYLNNPPVLLIDYPEDKTVVAGSDTWLDVGYYAPYPVPSFQWYISTDNGANFTPLIIAPPYSPIDPLHPDVNRRIRITGVTVAMTGYKYYCVVTNYLGTAVSRICTLTVLP